MTRGALSFAQMALQVVSAALLQRGSGEGGRRASSWKLLAWTVAAGGKTDGTMKRNADLEGDMLFGNKDDGPARTAIATVTRLVRRLAGSFLHSRAIWMTPPHPIESRRPKVSPTVLPWWPGRNDQHRCIQRWAYVTVPGWLPLATVHAIVLQRMDCNACMVMGARCRSARYGTLKPCERILHGLDALIWPGKQRCLLSRFCPRCAGQPAAVYGELLPKMWSGRLDDRYRFWRCALFFGDVKNC